MKRNYLYKHATYNVILKNFQDEFLRNMLFNLYKNGSVSLSNSKDFCSLYESNNATAFKHIESGVVLELVRKIFGEPEEIINQFDFTIVKFAYYKDIVEEDGEEITIYKAIYHKNFFEHLHLHRLIIDDKIPYPMSTFNRIIKYARYGYITCTETKQKIINALRSLSEDEILAPTNFYNGVD